MTLCISYTSPEILFARLLSKPECNHHFMTVTEVSKTTPPSFLCRKCFLHLLIQRCFTVGNNGHVCSSRIHYFETNIGKSISENVQGYARCIHCDLAWDLIIIQPKFSFQSLSELQRGNELCCQSAIYFMLIFYASNVYHGSPKPVNSANAKFAEYIGLNETRFSSFLLYCID